MYEKTDVDKHILNISSRKLYFFEKLVLCRGLKFAFHQKVSSLDVKASFEKAYWSLKPTLPNDLKELTAATLRSVALNYTKKKSQNAQSHLKCYKHIKNL